MLISAIHTSADVSISADKSYFNIRNSLFLANQNSQSIINARRSHNLVNSPRRRRRARMNRTAARPRSEEEVATLLQAWVDVLTASSVQYKDPTIFAQFRALMGDADMRRTLTAMSNMR